MAIHEAQLHDFVGGPDCGNGPTLASPRSFPFSCPNQLLASWLPALTGMQAKLQTGARIADVNCGSGATTIALALAYPRSLFFGYDLDEPAIERGRRAALEAGVLNRVYFQTVSPADFPGWDYDWILFLRGLVDLPNPLAAARRVRSSLTLDGSWVIVEQKASEDRVRQVMEAAGFTQSQRLQAAGPGPLVLEARLAPKN